MSPARNRGEIGTWIQVPAIALRETSNNGAVFSYLAAEVLPG
jgi:hypothetical protein